MEYWNYFGGIIMKFTQQDWKDTKYMADQIRDEVDKEVKEKLRIYQQSIKPIKKSPK